VGYNPLRKYRGGKAAEVAILVVFTAVLIGLIVWAVR